MPPRETSKTSESPKTLPKLTEILAPKTNFMDQPQTSDLETLKTPKFFSDLNHTAHGRSGRFFNI